MEVVRRDIDAALRNPATTAADSHLLTRMIVMDEKDQEARAEAARIAARDEQLEAELKTLGERTGAPIGRYLANEWGVTKATPILSVLPEKVFSSSSGSVGFFGKSYEGAEFSSLLPDPSERGNTFAALNLLRQAARQRVTQYSVLNSRSVMGDISKLKKSGISGIGSVRLAILEAIEAELPEPTPVKPINAPNNHGLSRLGFLRRLAPSQRSR
jgi:hypothetical protein